MNHNVGEEMVCISDDDDDDDHWISAPFLRYDMSYKPKKMQVGDNIHMKFPIVGDPEHRLFCQIVRIEHHEGGTLFSLMSEDSRPYDPPIVVDEKTMFDSSIVEPWFYMSQSLIFSKTLLQSCHDSGVIIQKTGYGKGYGLFATRLLCIGHLIPYWGKLSAIQHATGIYNIQISNNPKIYIIADRNEHRGPGAFCNDNTIFMHKNGHTQHTGKRPNAQILCHTPDEQYLHDWATYKNNGHDVLIYIEIIENVDPHDEIYVSYGASYWS